MTSAITAITLAYEHAKYNLDVLTYDLQHCEWEPVTREAQVARINLAAFDVETYEIALAAINAL